MSAAVAAHGDALNFDTPLNQPDKQLWGQLRLTGWEPKGQHPLASEQPNSAKLMGNGELIVGRNAQSVLRLHKSLVWCSNKHFVLQRDSQTGQVTVRDTSSNGTWVNGERVDKQVARVLKHGDHIELAAEEGTEFRQVTFTFDPKHGAQRSSEPLQKRPRLSSGSSAVGSVRTENVELFGGAAIALKDALSASAAAAASTAAAAAGEEAATNRAAEEVRRTAEYTLLCSELRAAEETGEAARASASSGEARAAADAAAANAAAAGAAASAATDLEQQLMEVRAQHQSERERLVERASESAQQLQEALQEQTAQRELREAAEEEATRRREAEEEARASLKAVEQQLQAERERAAAAEEGARKERDEAAALRAALAALRANIDAVLAPPQPTEAAAADVGACSPRTGAVDAGAADAESQEAKKWNATGIDY